MHWATDKPRQTLLAQKLLTSIHRFLQWIDLVILWNSFSEFSFIWYSSSSMPILTVSPYSTLILLTFLHKGTHVILLSPSTSNVHHNGFKHVSMVTNWSWLDIDCVMGSDSCLLSPVPALWRLRIYIYLAYFNKMAPTSVKLFILIV